MSFKTLHYLHCSLTLHYILRTVIFTRNTIPLYVNVTYKKAAKIVITNTA